MNKKISLGAAIAFMLIVATATFSMTMIFATTNFNQKVVALKEREAEYEKYSEIDRQVRTKYLGTINETQLMDSVARGFIAGLGDPYGSYIDARTYDKMIRSQEGHIAGIGIELSSSPGGDGYLTVLTVYPDSPAQAAGMEAGDLIVRIGEEDLTPENSAQLADTIQGESGTMITLVARKGTEDVQMEMTRRPVVIPTVYGSMLAETEIGYILIEQFNDNTSEQFNREVQRVISAGAKALVFDVRDNKGGVLRQAVRMLDKLLPAGLITAYTKQDGAGETYWSDANEIDLPMVVLVNAGSASSAELFAQVLRDYGKAGVVGVTTMGKGVVQETIPLNDGSAISITVAELIGPTGETFNKIGVKPDYEVSLAQGLNWRELTQDEDLQLRKAIEVAQGMMKPGEAEVPAPPDGQSDGSEAEVPAPSDGQSDGSEAQSTGGSSVPDGDPSGGGEESGSPDESDDEE